jgi:hypothetical protein
MYCARDICWQQGLNSLARFAAIFEGLEAKKTPELIGEVFQAVSRRASLGEVAALEACLVECKCCLLGCYDAVRTARDHGSCSVAAGGIEGGERADDVKSSTGVGIVESLEEHVGGALLVVVVVEQALGHDKHLAGVDVERDVLGKRVFLGNARRVCTCTSNTRSQRRPTMHAMRVHMVDQLLSCSLAESRMDADAKR